MITLKHNVSESFLKEEMKGILVSSKMKEVWAVELDLLAEFDAVCKKHNLKYTIAYGTLLGAARHKGFIPWDNDVDVVMLREDYEKLCAIAEEAFEAPYFFQTDKNTPAAARGHAQLRHSETTGILKSEMQNGKPLYGFNQGVFLDIFPLDNLPDDEKELECWLKEIQQCKNRIYNYKSLMRNKKITGLTSFKNAVLRLGIRVREFFTKTSYLECLNARLDEKLMKYRKQLTKFVSLPALNPMVSLKKRYKRSFFEQLTTLPFEHLELPVPMEYKELLDVAFGNWHEHVVGGETHGGVLFDVNQSYRVYLD